MEVTLLPLLKQDIKALDQLIEEVAGHLQIGDVQAWHGRGLPIEPSYRGHLEATLDRVYLLVQLFGHKGSGPAQKKTLGLGMRVLWNSLKRQPDGKVTVGLTTSTLSWKASQTELTALTSCDSCGSAISCVKRLLRALDQQPPARCAIFDVTQFGCMLKVTKSIEQALNRLLSQLFETQETNEVLSAENQRLRAKGALLEERVGALEAKLEAECRQALGARLEQERLAAFITALKDDHAQAIGRLQRAMPKPRRRLQMQLEGDVLQQHEVSVACLNAKLARLHKNSARLEMKLLGCVEGSREASAQLATLQESWVRFSGALRDRQKPKPLEGNPVEDIARAIDDNKRQVQALHEENERLQRLLHRLHRKNHDGS